MYALFDKDDWVEVQPPWPKRKPGARALARLLDATTPNGLPLLFRIQHEVSTSTLIETLGIASEAAREVLVRVISDRPDLEAAESIASLLSDPAAGVRGEAAHSIEHRGWTPFPEKLLEAIHLERDASTLELQLRALAAIGIDGARELIERIATDPLADDQTRIAAREALSTLRTANTG